MIRVACAYFAAIGLGLIASFGLFAFVIWEADPSKWTFDTRLNFAGVAMMVSWVATMVVATRRGDIG